MSPNYSVAFVWWDNIILHFSVPQLQMIFNFLIAEVLKGNISSFLLLSVCKMLPVRQKAVAACPELLMLPLILHLKKDIDITHNQSY